jgi:hypothetical protein
MKNILKFAVIITVVTISACRKDKTSLGPGPVTYSSLEDFHQKNGVKKQEFTINASGGGTYTSPQGTLITIPQNAFTDMSGNLISGNVTIEFKDIYKKSDMLLSDVGTTTTTGQLLKSGGEFWINANQNGISLSLASGKKIIVEQPVTLTGNAPDSAMGAFNLITDSTQQGWAPSPVDTLNLSPSSYIYYFYSLGSWSNSDNPSFFNSYSQTNLTLLNNNADGGDVYLIFQGVNSMVHVYASGASTHTYNYAPVGLTCTAVIINIKNNRLYAAFVPITVGNNQTYNYTTAAMSTDEFKHHLWALD